jgi:Flp pilus assembly protein TadD
MSNPRDAKKSRLQKDAITGAALAAWVTPLLVALLTTVAFLPALKNGFVGWDDYDNLLENPRFQGLDWTQLRWMFTTFHMSLYRPLTWVTLGLDYNLWGMNPFGYHLSSLIFHVVNAVLVYFLCLLLFRRAISSPSMSGEIPLRIAAGFAALLFALHPLRVEAVAWISARNDLVSGLFILAALLCYLKAAAGEKKAWWLSLAVVIYTLSLLSKASGMTLPAVLVVLDIYPLRRLGPGRWFGSEANKVWLEKVPFLFLGLAAAAIAVLAKQETGAMASFSQYGFARRLAQALFGLPFYLWKTLFPVGLSPLYELPSQFNPSEWRFILSGMAVLAITVVLFAFRRRWPAAIAIWACYVVLLLPVLGVAQSGPQIVADRYSYLACLGWAMLAGAGILYGWKLLFDGRIDRRVFVPSLGMGAIVLAGLGFMSWRQAEVWHDSERLWRHALAVSEGSNFQSSVAHYNLGKTVGSRGNLTEAIEHYRQALKIDPAYAKAHNNLGNALLVRGEVEEAIEHYRQALKVDPDHAKAHYNLGAALASRGDLAEAIEHFRQAVRIDPAYAKAHYNLGVALARRGNLAEAIGHFRQALRIQPDSAEAHESLGQALALQGSRDEAVQHYQQALSILKSRRAGAGLSE